MRVVFVHGWGFDRTLWNSVVAALPQFDSTTVELGFLGSNPSVFQPQPDDVLIGHSLGLLWGMTQNAHWSAVIAINAFACFTGPLESSACVRPATLRAMRLGLARDAAATLAKFYAMFDSRLSVGQFDGPRLADGLELLERQKITETLAVPSLVLASRNDPLVPVSASEALAARMQTAITWHDSGGHLLPLTQPLWCANAIRAFLE